MRVHRRLGLAPDPGPPGLRRFRLSGLGAGMPAVRPSPRRGLAADGAVRTRFIAVRPPSPRLRGHRPGSNRWRKPTLRTPCPAPFRFRPTRDQSRRNARTCPMFPALPHRVGVGGDACSYTRTHAQSPGRSGTCGAYGVPEPVQAKLSQTGLRGRRTSGRPGRAPGSESAFLRPVPSFARCGYPLPRRRMRLPALAHLREYRYGFVTPGAETLQPLAGPTVSVQFLLTPLVRRESALPRIVVGMMRNLVRQHGHRCPLRSSTAIQFLHEIRIPHNQLHDFSVRHCALRCRSIPKSRFLHDK